MSNSNKYYTQADIEKYLNGSMTPAEMHAMERAALDDAMLADAIDGYYGADKEDTEKHLAEINSALLNTSGKEKVITMPPTKTKWWRGIAAAATIVSIMLASWFLFLRKDEQKENVAQSVTIEKPVGSIKEQETSNPSVILKSDSEKLRLIEKKGIPITKPNKLSHPPSIEKKSISGDEVPTPQPQITAAAPKAAPTPVQNADEQKNIGTVDLRKAAAPALERTTLSDSHTLSYNKELQGRIAGLDTKKANALSLRDTINKNATSTNSLNEAVVIGYGVSKKNKSYSATPTVRVRGSQSLAEKTPLYIVNGKAMPETMFKTISPGEIKNIQVMKDSAATALYGSRAANGVIIITTIKHNPEPQKGWANFYTNIYRVVEKGNKILRISFVVKNGYPVDFSVIETPDNTIASKVIDAIKGTKWVVRNNLYNKVELALRVE